MNPSRVTASPLIWTCAAGLTTSIQVVPPLPLSQAALVVLTCARPDLPVTVVTTSPAIRIAFPYAAAYLMPVTRPAPAARPSCAASSRCQLIPLAERKTTGLACASSPPGTFDPAAMKPAAVRFRTLIWSPGRSGSPAVEASVQVRPSGLVQIAPGPRATQAPWPPATSRAA